MNFTEYLNNLKFKGSLEIVVSDHNTGEIIRHDEDHNQLQTWVKHSLSFLNSGKPFCTWGNHGEEVNDVGGAAYSIPHYADGSNTTLITATPWTYSNALNGLVQKRDVNLGDIMDANIPIGDPVYPFFPTKMRFGTGGLDASQNPRDDISVDATTLIGVDMSYPFVVVDRAITTQHIMLSESSSNTINKVTYSVKLPGGDPNYPYNGKIISEAGLFCDAALKVGNDYNMRTGLMLSYRTFRGIVKDESIDIQFNWSWLF